MVKLLIKIMQFNIEAMRTHSYLTSKRGSQRFLSRESNLKKSKEFYFCNRYVENLKNKNYTPPTLL